MRNSSWIQLAEADGQWADVNHGMLEETSDKDHSDLSHLPPAA